MNFKFFAVVSFSFCVINSASRLLVAVGQEDQDPVASPQFSPERFSPSRSPHRRVAEKQIIPLAKKVIEDRAIDFNACFKSWLENKDTPHTSQDLRDALLSEMREMLEKIDENAQKIFNDEHYLSLKTAQRLAGVAEALQSDLDLLMQLELNYMEIIEILLQNAALRMQRVCVLSPHDTLRLLPSLTSALLAVHVNSDDSSILDPRSSLNMRIASTLDFLTAKVLSMYDNLDQPVYGLNDFCLLADSGESPFLGHHLRESYVPALRKIFEIYSRSGDSDSDSVNFARSIASHLVSLDHRIQRIPGFFQASRGRASLSSKDLRETVCRAKAFLVRSPQPSPSGEYGLRLERNSNMSIFDSEAGEKDGGEKVNEIQEI